MDRAYIISIDQSTQGTKALLFDWNGNLVERTDLPHKQIIDDFGWVSHDLNEIYSNTIQAVKNLIAKTGIQKARIAGVGISNQRETSAAWNKDTGKPVAPAIVWQCCRAEGICAEISAQGKEKILKQKTGLNLSPYFPAAKYAWILRNVECAEELQRQGKLLFGTIDTWLIYKLTGGKAYKTDYSNASRSQLFNIHTLRWDEDICRMFGVRVEALAEVCDSNAVFGETDFEGCLDRPIPICGVLGDSHGALFGQGCLRKGMVKATYGTGSSIMMNVGEQPVIGQSGVVTSLAWGIDGTVDYVLEGNVNYTGAVISWLINDLKLIASAEETETLAKHAKPEDTTFLVPAFSGLGAPYWDSGARAAVSGMSRMTGKAELVKAALESIAYQITDVLEAMKRESGIEIEELRVDGGPTKNEYLMQFQSDMAQIPVQVSEMEELSGIGAAYMAGFALGMYNDKVFDLVKRKHFHNKMERDGRDAKYMGWKQAVGKALSTECPNKMRRETIR